MRNSIESVAKIFKDADDFLSYLTNMRINPNSFGIPLVVERF